MHSLTRIKVLQRRCTVFHSQCESILLRYQDEDRGLQAEEEAILEQIAGLKLLLDTLRAENRQLSREEIYTVLTGLIVMPYSLFLSKNIRKSALKRVTH